MAESRPLKPNGTNVHTHLPQAEKVGFGEENLTVWGFPPQA